MRRNIALCIVFSIITFGIYEIYWFIVATNEINRMTRHPNQTSGGIAFLLSLITFGIYSYYWASKVWEKSRDMLIESVSGIQKYRYTGALSGTAAVRISDHKPGTGTV